MGEKVFLLKVEMMDNAVYKVLVMYYSKTDNTKKLAEEIVKGVQEVEDVEWVL